MVWEIIIIVLGIIAVAAGYLIPAKRDENDSEAEAFSREQVQTIVAEEMEAAKGQITDLVDETITYAMEKTERSMDRISNEKMMAVSEYSDTVLDQINKNHEEVVFLYDMLNDKHENLKETVAEASKAASEVKATIKEAEEVSSEVVSFEAITPASVTIPADESVAVQDTSDTPKKEKKSSKKKDDSMKPVPVIKAPVFETIVLDDSEEEAREEEWDDFETEDMEEDADGPQITFNSRTPGSRNSNERILELHKQGKSNMAIAKELGLGVGEVKLVIDLFKGM